MSSFPLAVLAGSLLIAAAAFAQPPRPAPFVTPEQLNSPSILPAPPAKGSWQLLEELAELHRIEQTRTPEQIAHAQADDRAESIFAFADVLGPKFSRASLPLTALLSDHVKANEGPIVNPAKRFFERPRPYFADSTLHPVCKKANSPTDYSYPSGHGTTGYLEALVLAQMIPEKRDAFLARADDYAHSREVCGEHYPSDEVASKAVAYAIFGLMANHPQFQKELEQAAAETRAALGLSAPSASAK